MRGDDVPQTHGTTTAQGLGAWERTHHKKGSLCLRYRAQAPRGERFFTGFREAEASQAGQVVRMKPHWGGPDGHAMELGPGRSRDGWRVVPGRGGGGIDFQIFLVKPYLLYNFLIFILNKIINVHSFKSQVNPQSYREQCPSLCLRPTGNLPLWVPPLFGIYLQSSVMTVLCTFH